MKQRIVAHHVGSDGKKYESPSFEIDGDHELGALLDFYSILQRMMSNK